MYRIGMFSKLGKTTIKTLRHYDEVGLLSPAQVDEWTGYRFYTSGQLFKLQEIVALRQMGFSIPEVKAIIDGRNVSEILEQRKAEMESELRFISDQFSRLNNYISQNKEGQSMSYQVVIKEIPKCIVFSSRQVIPNHSALFELVPAIGARVAAANPGIKCAEPDYSFNVYLDGEYKETDINIEVCQAVTSFGKNEDGIEFKELPDTTVASAFHKGGYDKLATAYAYLTHWITDNGYTVSGEPRESYIDGIWNKDTEDEWLTEIQIPIAK